MAPHKLAGCVDCRINKRIREIAKQHCGDCISTPCPFCRKLRAFGREVARAVKREIEAEHEG
jgi:hypothetical protein